MGVTVSIDTGGTFTDGYFTREDPGARGVPAMRIERVKVDTTPHDLTEGLARCLAAGATGLGYAGVQAMLLDTDAFRFSSTIGTNSIIQRTEPRIGLLVSAGAAETLYGPSPSPLYDRFLRRDLVADLADPHDPAEVKAAVRRLLVSGAGCWCPAWPAPKAIPAGSRR